MNTTIKLIRKNQIILLLSLIAIVVWATVYIKTFNGLWFPDSCEYASIASNIYEGKGLTTNTLNVAHIQFFKERIKDSRFPIIGGPPLYPLFISGLFHIFGVSDRVVGLSSGIFFILTVPFLYLLAKSLFGSTVAVISSLIYIFDTHLLFTYSICGLTEPMFIFFLVQFFFILYKSKKYKFFLLAGAVMGLANLNRFNPIFYLLPIIGYILLCSEDGKIKNAVGFFFGFTIIMTPYFIRNYLEFNNPFIFFIRSYELFPDELGLSFTIFQKLYINMSEYYHRFFRIANPYILAFFVVSIFKTYENKNLRNFRILFLVMFAVQILVSSAAVPTPKSFGQFRHLVIFYPVMIIFASSLIVSMFERFKQSSRLTKYSFGFLIILLICLPTITNFYHTFRSNLKTSRHSFKEIGEMVRSNTSPDEIVATDISYQLAWYSQRKVLIVPVTSQQLASIDSDLPIRTMLITSSIRDDLKWINEPELTKEWGAFLNGFPESFLGFELKEKMERDGKIIAALYIKKEDAAR